METKRPDRATRPQAGRRDDRPKRRQQVIGQVGQDRPALGRSAIAPSGASSRA